MFRHVQAALPWTVRTPVTAHVLRHTGATAIERIAGSAVAEAFLGHAPSSVTGTYTKGRLDEVAAAVATLTGEPHPLAAPPVARLPAAWPRVPPFALALLRVRTGAGHNHLLR